MFSVRQPGPLHVTVEQNIPVILSMMRILYWGLYLYLTHIGLDLY